jgi:nucleotide-binding universal stress UspA family protein
LQHIVVGIDGSAVADRALRWALDEARRWDARLEVVLAWSYIDQHTPDFHPDYGEGDARATLAAAIERAGGAEGIDVVQSCPNDLPARALLAAAAPADLVVVGSRGLGSVKGMLLGSVSHQVVTKSPTNVVIVRPEGAAR